MKDNSKILSVRVSVVRNFSDLIAAPDIMKIFEAIKNGKYKQQIENIRRLINEGKDKEASNLKKKLDGFTPGGVFKDKRNSQSLQEYSKVVILDFDHVDCESFERFLTSVNRTNFTLCSFVSPSGNGMKVLVRVDSSQEMHKVAFEQVSAYYEKLLGIDVDRSGSDLARLCFFSYDSNLFYNPTSTVFNVAVCNSISKANFFVFSGSSYENEKYSDALKYTNNLAKFEEGNRNNFVFTLAKNCRIRGLTIETTKQLILQQFNYGESEVVKTIESAFKVEVEEETEPKEPVFSIHYLNSQRFKSCVKADERALFEIFLLKFFKYRKPFYYSKAQIENELGVKKDRAKTIIRKFEQLGFLKTSVQRSSICGKPRQITYFEVLVDNLDSVIDELMIAGEEFKAKVKPLIELKHGTDIKYGFEE